MTKYRYWVVTAVLFWLAAQVVVLSPAPAISQIPGTAQKQTEAPAPEKPEGPQPIPASQISIKAEETAQVLRSLRDRPEIDPSIRKINEALPAMLGRLQDLLGETENRLKGTVSTRALEDLERRWSRRRDRVHGWQSTVNRRAQDLDRDLQTLQDLSASWEVTLETAGDTGLPDALREVARASRASIEETEKRFGGRRSEISSVQGQVAQAAGIIRDALDRIEAARARTRLKLWSFDARPLWEVILHPPARAEHRRYLVTAWEETKRDLREFVDAYRDSLIVHVLSLLLLIILLFLLRRRTRAIGRDEVELEASARVLSRPVSTAATLWVLITLFLFPEAPRLVDELATLVLFLPLIRILPARMVASIPGLLAALVGVNVFGRFIDLLAYMSPLYRFALLLESIACLVVVAASLRRTRPVGGEPSSTWRRTIRTIQWIAVLYLSAAVVSNIVGNVSFAATVTRASYLSAYLGLALFAVFHVLSGVVQLAVRSRTFRRLKMVRRHDQLIRQRILTLLRIVFFAWWLFATLKAMQIFVPLFHLLATVLTAKAHFGQLGISLGGIISFALTVWAAFLISRFLRFILEEDVYPRLTLPRGVSNAVSIGIHYSLLLLGFFLAVAATGADLGKATILAGAFGVGVGFGLQNIVNNFISGLILIVERPILPGDTVQIDTLYGEVKRIGLRSSTVRTWEGAEVIVPNGNLISSQVVNWTLSDRQRRLDIPVGVAYGTDPQKVIDLLIETGSEQDGVLENPAPSALFLGFGDSSLDFQLRVWTAETGFLKLKSNVTVAVNEALKEAGITIPFPQRDVHLKSIDEEAKGKIPDVTGPVDSPGDDSQ
jgi:potassium efflux system protein